VYSISSPGEKENIQRHKIIFQRKDTSVADPHQKNADADPGKNIDADPDSCPC
jgi:hypothetical protein